MTESCHQFDALIARAAQLTKEESARLEAHLVGCGACRELARALMRSRPGDLIQLKRLANRPEDQRDIEALQAIRRSKRDG